MITELAMIFLILGMLSSIIYEKRNQRVVWLEISVILYVAATILAVYSMFTR